MPLDMKILIRTIVLWFSVAPSLAAGGAITWAGLAKAGLTPVLTSEFEPWMAKVNQIEISIALIQWQVLNERSKSQYFTPDERLALCKLSKALEFHQEGCR